MVGCLLFDPHISVPLRVGARRRLWPPRAHQPSRYLLPKSPAKIGLFFKKDQQIIFVCVSTCSSSPASIQGDPIRDDQDGSKCFFHFDCLWRITPFRKRSEHSRCPRIHKIHIEAASSVCSLQCASIFRVTAASGTHSRSPALRNRHRASYCTALLRRVLYRMRCPQDLLMEGKVKTARKEEEEGQGGQILLHTIWG